MQKGTINIQLKEVVANDITAARKAFNKRFKDSYVDGYSVNIDPTDKKVHIIALVQVRKKVKVATTASAAAPVEEDEDDSYDTSW